VKEVSEESKATVELFPRYLRPIDSSTTTLQKYRTNASERCPNCETLSTPDNTKGEVLCWMDPASELRPFFILQCLECEVYWVE
jgi:hypothetical protein